MKRLNELKTVIYAELTENEFSRKNDAALVMGVLKRIGVDTQRSFADLSEHGELRQLESITRCRRKIQQEPPELKREFKKPCIDKYGYCQGCVHGLVTIPPDEEEYAYYHGGNYEFFGTHCTNYLTRPPQSWCYVEVG